MHARKAENKNDKVILHHDRLFGGYEVRILFDLWGGEIAIWDTH